LSGHPSQLTVIALSSSCSRKYWAGTGSFRDIVRRLTTPTTATAALVGDPDAAWDDNH
jgi:hypothetical protein